MKRILSILYCAWCWSASATIFTTDGSQAQIYAASTNAVSGDTITMPVGTHTLGAGGAQLVIPDGVKLIGASTNTVINLDATGPKLTDGGVIVLGAGSVFSNCWVNGIASVAGGGTAVTAIYVRGEGAIIAYTTFSSPTNVGGYYAFIAGVGGIDFSNTIIGNNGALQTFMDRGDTNSWGRPSNMGSTNGVWYNEANYFTGAGETDQCEGSGRMCTRSNYIVGSWTIDSHQYETSSDLATTPHGSRQHEIYGNHFASVAFVDSIWVMSGAAMVFNNDYANTSGNWIKVAEYGSYATTSNHLFASSGGFANPTLYPIKDQVGMNNLQQPATDPAYFFNNQQAGGMDMGITLGPVSSQAIAAYGQTFSMTNFIMANREYFYGQPDITFSASSGGVGIGSTNQMYAITPTIPKVGFWVTNENALYQWTGSAWTNHYKPLGPHPLRLPAFVPPVPALPTGVLILK